MPKQPRTDRESLPALLAQNDGRPSVVATKALIRAAFLFTDSPDQPYRALGLSLSEVDVLGAIARAEGMVLTCSDIADATLITKGGITGILDRLEARRLVERTPSRDDRRSIMIQLTEKGVEVCLDLFSKMARNNEEIFAKALKPDQIKQFCKLITMLVRSFEVDTHATRAGASEATHGHERI
jgi:MarR family transcriptional regulator, 2-MHQ and catechol-resistance regulon repressor